MLYAKSIQFLNTCSAWAFYHGKPKLGHRFEGLAKDLKRILNQT